MRNFLITCLLMLIVMPLAGESFIKIHYPEDDRVWVGEKTIHFEIKGSKEERILSAEVFIDGKLVREFRRPPYKFTYDFGKQPYNRKLKVVYRENGNIVAQKMIQSYFFENSHNVDVVEMVVPVALTDRSGRYLNSVRREHFELLVDGKPQDITFFSKKGDIKTRIVMLIDISSSMKDKIGTVKEAAKDFLRTMLSKDNKGIVILFNHEVFEDTEFTADVKKLVNSISLAYPFGATALYDAVDHCMKLVKNSAGRNILVLFSDGEDNSSYLDPYTLLKKIEQSNFSIYSIGRKDKFAVDNKHQRILESLSGTSGGVTFFIDSLDELDRVYKEIKVDIDAKFILQFNLGKIPKKNKFRKIEVRIKRSGLAQKVKIRTIRGFYH